MNFLKRINNNLNDFEIKWTPPPLLNCRCSLIFDGKIIDPNEGYCPYKDNSKEIANNYLRDKYIEN